MNANTCPFIAPRTSLKGPQSTFNITDHFDCTSSNIVYCILCSHCKMLYVGETGRRLGDRFRDHIYDIRKKDLSKPVTRHFNSVNHSLRGFMLLFLVFLTHGSNNHRKTKEMRLINSMGTLKPRSRNE